MAPSFEKDRLAPSPLALRVMGEIDRLSLAQALVDVEVANARVVDLTARLVTAERRLREVTDERDALGRGGAAMAAAPATPAQPTVATPDPIGVSAPPEPATAAHRGAAAARAATITARRAVRVARRVRAALRTVSRP